MPRRTLAFALALLAVPFTAATPMAQELSAGGVVIEPGDREASPGDRVELDYVVGNAGPGDAEDVPVGFFLSVDAAYSDDDPFLEAEDVSVDEGESEGESEQVTLPDAVPPGCYHLLVFVDYPDVFDEANETDNVAASEIAIDVPLGECAPVPDLRVRDASVTPASAPRGAVVTATATLENVGAAGAADAELSTYLSDDAVYDPLADTFMGFGEVDYLGAGGSEVLSDDVRLPSGFPAGGYTLFFVADGGEDLPESDETNNVAAVPVTLEEEVVGPFPDLTLTSATISPQTLEPGATGTVTAEASNPGAPAPRETTLEVRISVDPVYDESDVLLVEVGPSIIGCGGDACDFSYLTDFSLPADAPVGRYYAVFFANGIDVDADSTDNVLVREVTIGSPPLSLDLESAEQQTIPAEGGPIEATARVEASEDVSFDWWAVLTHPDGARELAVGPQSATLGAGERTTIDASYALPGSAPVGDYALRLYAGTFDAVSYDRALVVASKTTSTGGDGGPAPSDLALRSIAPNPALGAATVRYTLPAEERVRLALYDVLGREVAVLVDGPSAAGRHEARLDAGSLPAGVYVVRLQAGGASRTGLLTVVR